MCYKKAQISTKFSLSYGILQTPHSPAAAHGVASEDIKNDKSTAAQDAHGSFSGQTPPLDNRTNA